MKKLINIQKTTIGESEVNAVSARELYLGLGLASDQWARWSKVNIEQNEFFSQGVDFVQLHKPIDLNIPNPPKDYLISIRFAKHIINSAKTISSKIKMDMLIELGVDTESCINSRAEIEFIDFLERTLEPFEYETKRQYIVDNYRIDFVIVSIGIAIEYDEPHHKHQKYKDDIRQKEIESKTGFKFVRLNSVDGNAFNVGLVFKAVMENSNA